MNRYEVLQRTVAADAVLSCRGAGALAVVVRASAAAGRRRLERRARRRKQIVRPPASAVDESELARAAAAGHMFRTVAYCLLPDVSAEDELRLQLRSVVGGWVVCAATDPPRLP